jgi:hypothetical protein
MKTKCYTSIAPDMVSLFKILAISLSLLCFAISCKKDIIPEDISIITAKVNCSVTAGRTKEITLSSANKLADDVVFNITNNPGFLNIEDNKNGTAKLVISPEEKTEYIGIYEVTIKVTKNNKVIEYQNITMDVNEPLNVITIYFCGSGITKEWKDGNKAYWDKLLKFGFFVPEMTASLWEQQKTDKDSIHNHYKFIVDGIGAGLDIPLIEFIFVADPSLTVPRNWDYCVNEAIQHINSVASNSIGDIKLNLIGHSRGGVTAMMVAKEVEQLDKVKEINIIGLDPIPGELTIKVDNSNFILGNKVKNYIGFYPEDEHSKRFVPIIPKASSSLTNMWIFTVPGSHETFVGNNKTNGHSIPFYFFFAPIKHQYTDELLNNSWVTEVIITEILGSPSGGNVEYNWDWNKNKNLFISNYNKMYDYDYGYMKKVGFTLDGLTAYWNGKSRLCLLANQLNNPRVASHIDTKNERQTVALTSVAVTHNGLEAWNKLQSVINSTN